MKIAFFSCFLTHHQTPLCLAFNELTKGEFVFVSTSPINQERLGMGYEDLDSKYGFVLREYENDEAKRKAMDIALKCDVMIIGSAPEVYMVERLKKKKLTFLYSERWYKKGTPAIRFVRDFLSSIKHHGRYQHYHPYMLCASAYTASDCARFGNYLNRTYKWGYFPEVTKENLSTLFEKKQANITPKILWVGRLIDWKHPESCIFLADYLMRKGIEFQLEIIGNGVMEKDIEQSIANKNMLQRVQMLGAMPPDAVREHMRCADILIFTSDYNEGWGAVLNEAMNSGCAVVASHAIGAVGFLMKNGENGIIYENGNQNQLNEMVEELITNPEYRRQLGKAAYRTLEDEWNADCAAERFLKLAAYLKDGNEGSPFTEGPCSVAYRVSNKKAERQLMYSQRGEKK